MITTSTIPSRNPGIVPPWLSAPEPRNPGIVPPWLDDEVTILPVDEEYTILPVNPGGETQFVREAVDTSPVSIADLIRPR